MRKQSYLVLLSLCIGGVCPTPPTGNTRGTPPEVFQEEPQEAIVAFVHNFNRGSLEGLEAAASEVHGASESDPALAEVLRVLKQQGNSVRVDVTEFRVTKKNDIATVTLKALFQDYLLRTVAQTETVQLRRHEEKVDIDGVETTFINWRIVPGTPEAVINSPQSSLVRTMATYIAFPQRMLKLSLFKLARFRVEQVNKGMKGFLSDWEGEFVKQHKGKPFLETQQSWRSSIGMYMPEEAAFQVPHSTTGETYQFNLELVGKKVSDIKQPSKTVMVYDGQKGKLIFRHDGLSLILFVDGHIELVNRQQATAMIWKP